MAIRKSLVEIIKKAAEDTLIDLEERSMYAADYWSANKVNFDAEQMPQKRKGTYRGRLWIAQLNQELDRADLQDLLKRQRRELAEVVEAMWLGKNNPDVVRKHKTILIPGSVGHPPKTREWFCPTLFTFSQKPKASVSLGIDPLERKYGEVIIPRGSLVLVADHQ